MSETKKAMNYELLFMQAVGLLGVINAHYMCIESYIHNIFNYYTWLMAFFIFLSGLLFARRLPVHPRNVLPEPCSDRSVRPLEYTPQLVLRRENILLTLLETPRIFCRLSRAASTHPGGTVACIGVISRRIILQMRTRLS